MKAITEQVKNVFKQPTTKRKGVILVNGNYYDVYGVEYYADCYDEGKVIGNAIASQLDFDIPYMPKFDTFQYFDCIWNGNSYEHIDYGTFTVFDEKDQDEFNKHITAFDNLIKFNVPFQDKYDYPKTLYDELVNVCQQAGVTLGNVSIPNGSFVVENNQFTDGESLKTVLKQICAISGNYAVVKNNVLYLQLRNVTNEVIDKSQHEPVDWKRRSYGINQVILGDSQVEGEYVIREDAEDIALNGVHKLEILDNLFAYTQDKRSALIDNLFNQVRGFGYIPFETKGEWLSYLEIGDTINLDGTDTILLRINAKSPDALNTTMSAPAIIDSSIEYVDNTADVNNRMKLTERSVDKQNQVITDVVSDVDDQNTKISQITQTVDEINSKIQDISDITVSGESSYAAFSLENVNESEPIQIKVRPVNENISYLYPSTGLYPSDNLYLKVRTIRFHNNTTNENIDYELPDDLLIYDEETYDEFYLDYDSQTCQVTKRCQYNADGSVSPLATEQVINYPYPTITLTDGDYALRLIGYQYGYLFVRLMTKNIYTSQFYTKAETNSRINQKADEINLGVTQTLSNYSTTDQMNAAINVKANQITSEVSSTYATKTTTNQLSTRIAQTAKGISLTVNNGSTSSGITIGVTKEDGTTEQTSGTIQMNGLVKFTDLSGSGTTTINGANIQTGTLSASKITTGTLSANRVSGGTLQGSSVIATSGRIGGWTLEQNALSAENGSHKVILTNISNSNQDFIVVKNGDNYPFWVRGDGTLYAGNATINGTVNASSGSFTGTVNATSGSFSGSIYAGSGNIGAWTLNSTGIYSSDAQIFPSYLGYKYNGTGGWTSQAWWRIGQAASDKRLKKNINSLEDKYNKFFDELKPVSFKWKDDEKDKEHIGFIAQDIQEAEKNNGLDLDIVYKNETDDYLNLDKRELIALNTWQIQKLKEEIKELKQELAALKKEIK